MASVDSLELCLACIPFTLACGPLGAADCNSNGSDDADDIARGIQFATPRHFPVGGAPHVVIAADLDGDLNLDLVTSDRADDTLTVLRGDGKGAFGPREALPVADEPRGIAAGDVDGDGNLDLVSGNGNEDDAGELPTDSLLLNAGAGRFPGRRDFTGHEVRAGALRSVHLADIDGDADIDIVNGFSASEAGGVITLLGNDGRSAFSSPVALTAADADFAGLRSAKYLAVAPVGGGALPDIVTVSGQVLRSLGGGRFSSPVSFTELYGLLGLTLADLDLDGDLDAAFVRVVPEDIEQKGEVILFENEGDSFREGPLRVLLPSQAQVSIAAADLDGDGAPELAALLTAGRVAVLRRGEEGAYAVAPETLPLESGLPRWVIAGDLDGDGRADLAVPKMNDVVSVLLNATSADVDGNAIPDECEPRFFRGDPDGDGKITLTDAVFLLLGLFLGGEAPRCAEAADSNDDGRVDLSDAVHVLRFLFQAGPPPGPPGPPRPPAEVCPGTHGELPFLGCADYRSCP